MSTTTTGPTAPGRVDATTVSTWMREPGTVTVLDVRSTGEFAAMHIAGSHNVPLEVLGQHASAFAARLAPGNEDHQRNSHRVVLVCQSGVRATQARQRLAAAGLQNLTENVHVLEGGVPSYAAAGGEVVRGQGRWAMDRQVRLVAGSIVLASTLASLAAPKARFLAGGIGAGLTYSALSNSCAMATVLGKLPYNRGPKNPDVNQIINQLPTPNTAQNSTPRPGSRG